MSPNLLGVRRMSNRPLPSLVVKKIKIENLKMGGNDDLAKDWPAKYEPFILTMRRENEFPKLRWMTI